MISPSPSEFLQDTAMSSRNLGQTFPENSVERLIKIIRQRTTTCERAPSLSRCDTPNLTTTTYCARWNNAVPGPGWSEGATPPRGGQKGQAWPFYGCFTADSQTNVCSNQLYNNKKIAKFGILKPIGRHHAKNQPCTWLDLAAAAVTKF